jgi:hypothetical protein
MSILLPERMPNVSIKTGDFRLIDSGVVHVPRNDTLVMTIGGNEYTFEFLDDSNPPRYEGFAEEKNYRIRIYNHNNTAGMGSLEPMEILSYTDGAKLYLTYFVSVPVGAPGRRFEFCLYKKYGSVAGMLASAIL